VIVPAILEHPWLGYGTGCMAALDADKYLEQLDAATSADNYNVSTADGAPFLPGKKVK
jgi:hypothetical protein